MTLKKTLVTYAESLNFTGKNLQTEMENLNNNVNLRFKEVRRLLKLSQPEFAEKLGMTQAAVSMIESGKTKNPSIEIIDRLVRAYPQVNVSWLFSGEGKIFKTNQASEPSKTKKEKSKYPEFNLPSDFRDIPVLKEYETKVKSIFELQNERIEALESDKAFLQNLLQSQNNNSK